MRKKLNLFSVLFFLVLSLQAFAQEKTITGKVVDENGAPLPGVTVVIDGTTQGTITDPDGNYTVSVPSGDAVLIFSFVGYQTQRIKPAGKTSIDLKMKPDVFNLEEVVAVGYGTMKKSDLSGASVSMGEDDINC